jgi:hypothetical protein
MSMSEPFQPNLPQPSDHGDVTPDDDLAVDDELAIDDGLAVDDDLDSDGTPVGDGSRTDEDLADLPENTLFRTPEPGDRLSPEDLGDVDDEDVDLDD